MTSSVHFPTVESMRATGRFGRVTILASVIAALVATVAAFGLSLRAASAIDVIVPGCVVGGSDFLGWWKGDDDLNAQIGPNLSGSVAFTDGLIGRSMNFDGTNVVSTTALPAIGTGLTIDAWVRPVNVGTLQSVMSRWDFPSTDDSARALALFIDPLGRLLWTTDETSTRRPEELNATVPSPHNIFDGSWHHVAATWDATTMIVYFDGAPIATAPSRGGVLNPAASVEFRLGSKLGLGSPTPFVGRMDEPSVIGRALTAAEVDLLVAAGPNGKCVAVSTRGIVGPGLQLPGDVGGRDPVVSDDGRYLVFTSRSGNLTPVVGDPLLQTPGADLDLVGGGRDDVYLLDRKGTVSGADDTLELVSVDSNELGGGFDSFDAAVTPSGSHVAFASISDDLVVADTLAGADLFLRNRVTGTTQRISVKSDGLQPELTPTGQNNLSRAPSINAAGNVIAFQSTNRSLAPETNPVPGDTWQSTDIYVRDISNPNPALWATTRITTALGDVKADGSSIEPIISPDGRYVWFSSTASNLVASDTNGVADIFRYDRQTSTMTRLALTNASGQPLDADAWLSDVSPDGRWVAFSSVATTIVAGDTNTSSDAFVFDAQNVTVRRVSAVTVQGNGPSVARSVSDNGRYVMFQSASSNLVLDDTNAVDDLFLADITANTTKRVSLTVNGLQRSGSLGSVSAASNSTGKLLLYHYQDTGQSVFSIIEAKLALA